MYFGWKQGFNGLMRAGFRIFRPLTIVFDLNHSFRVKGGLILTPDRLIFPKGGLYSYSARGRVFILVFLGIFHRS